MNCKKCNSNRTDWAEQVRLIGGVSARLCINCVNAFDRHVRLMPLWSEMESVNDAIEDVKIAAYGREEPTEKLAPLRARARAIERKWRAIGYEWLGIVVDEPQASAAVDPVDRVTTVAACGTKFSTYEEMAHHSKKHEADGPRHEPVQTAEEEKTLSRVERCEGRYPVPQTSPPREEPFEVTYRCGLAQGHLGPHGCEPPVDGPHHEQDRPEKGSD
jgi:hypothetical protein